MRLYTDQSQREAILASQGGLCAVSKRLVSPREAILVVIDNQIRAVHLYVGASVIDAVRDQWVKRTGWEVWSVPPRGHWLSPNWPESLPNLLRGWFALAHDLTPWLAYYWEPACSSLDLGRYARFNLKAMTPNHVIGLSPWSDCGPWVVLPRAYGTLNEEEELEWRYQAYRKEDWSLISKCIRRAQQQRRKELSDAFDELDAWAPRARSQTAAGWPDPLGLASRLGTA